MRLELKALPHAKKRHRMANGIAYDPQSKTCNAYKWLFAQFMRERDLKMLNGPIAAYLMIDVPMPPSWSKKRKEEMRGQYVTSRPDNDNYEKFYFDVLNGIAYPDDAFIALNWTQKIYADKPRVVIELNPLGGNMITEHAITYKDKLSADDISYIIKKANRLGLTGRQVARVYSQEDDEGTHIYFEVEGPKEKKDV